VRVREAVINACRLACSNVGARGKSIWMGMSPAGLQVDGFANRCTIVARISLGLYSPRNLTQSFADRGEKMN
jgi:hypothetical protein